MIYPTHREEIIIIIIIVVHVSSRNTLIPLQTESCLVSPLVLFCYVLYSDILEKIFDVNNDNP